MKIMGMRTPEVVTVMDADKRWQAIVMENHQNFSQPEQCHDTKEAALEAMLEVYSYSLYCKFKKHLK